MQRDLKRTLLKSFERASNTIYLSIYSLTDSQIIEVLSKQAERGLDVQLLLDQKQIKSLKKKISSKVQLHSIKQRGLMHQKIFVVDDVVFIGSTNLTQTSLRMHDNLMAGFYAPQFSQTLKKHLLNQDRSMSFSNSPSFEFYTLPNKDLLDHILDKIEKAKHSIFIAMFTFTHPKILQALSKAKDRGIQIHVILDYLSHKGASRKAAEKLKEYKIKVSHNRGIQMMHHKLAVFDHKTVIMGSTNWTQSAFEKNQEALLFLNELSKKEIQFIETLCKNLELESKEI